MEGLKGFQWCLIAIFTMALMMSGITVQGQINKGCTTSMLSIFTPCINFITATSANASSPTAKCCRSFESLMNTSMDCTCLIVSGNVPMFTLPVNRTLALSLPRACNMSRVPIQCKAAGSPIPSPASGVPKVTSPAQAPQPQIPTVLSPASPPLSSEAPATLGQAPATLGEAPATLGEAPTTLGEAPTTLGNAPTTSGIHPVVTPSAANPSQSFSPYLLFFVIGVLALKYH